jgi:hypothetical protein
MLTGYMFRANSVESAEHIHKSRSMRNGDYDYTNIPLVRYHLGFADINISSCI